MVPRLARSWQPLEYWNDSPGLSTGWCPTTPMPLTSSVWPLASLMFQWRDSSWPVASPILVMVMV